MLLLTIALICFIMEFTQHIMKLVIAAKHLVQKQPKTNPELIQRLTKAREELAAVQQQSSLDEYTLTVKTMRAEQKVLSLEQLLQQENAPRCMVLGFPLEFVGNYTLKTLLGLTLFIITVCYRYTPVIVFDDSYSFMPFEFLLRFPTAVHNAISVPVWTLSCKMFIGKVVEISKKIKQLL